MDDLEALRIRTLAFATLAVDNSRNKKLTADELRGILEVIGTDLAAAALKPVTAVRNPLYKPALTAHERDRLDRALVESKGWQYQREAKFWIHSGRVPDDEKHSQDHYNSPAEIIAAMGYKR